MYEIGFTGTQVGMTAAQRNTFKNLLSALRPSILHHGDCIGADAQAHVLAKSVKTAIVIHPPSDNSKRAYCKGAVATREPKPYLKRNADIVTESEALIAAPKEFDEQLRSGTWATIREAKRQQKVATIIYPDGTYAVFE